MEQFGPKLTQENQTLKELVLFKICYLTLKNIQKIRINSFESWKSIKISIKAAIISCTLYSILQTGDKNGR